jgi:uncharacterized surface protein with fasciclin (FAS1) repeats
MRSKLVGTAIAAAGLSLAAAACSSSGTPSSAPATSHSPAAMDKAAAMAGTFGVDCAKIPATGTGSFIAMAGDSVTTAASHNPQLTELAHAIKEAGLKGTLASAHSITVFAPDNSAFAALPKSELDTLMANKSDLADVLKFHVVDHRLTPAELDSVKSVMTMLGQPVKIVKMGSTYEINGAQVVCGNIKTANATVYIINKVLIP